MKQELNLQYLNKKFAKESPELILEYFINNYKDKLVFGSSLGAEDQVLTKMITDIDKTIKIFTLDTGRLFNESYDLIQRTNEYFNIQIKIYFPDYLQVEDLVSQNGINLFYKSVNNRELCCNIRKIEPLKRALKNKNIWFTGIRREQSISRFSTNIVEWEEQYNIIKVNPLNMWTEKEVWNYINKNNIPYNPLHDKGFRSISCEPCTRAVKSGEDFRSGRWWWEPNENKECGIHHKPDK